MATSCQEMILITFLVDTFVAKNEKEDSKISEYETKSIWRLLDYTVHFVSSFANCSFLLQINLN